MTQASRPERPANGASFIQMLVKQEDGRYTDYGLPASRIENIEPAGPNKSHIVLVPRSAPSTWVQGSYSPRLTVYLPYEQLARKLYGNESQIDLRNDCLPPALRRQPGQYQVGAPVSGGAVYAGISPDTGKPLYAAAEDERGNMGLRAAFRRATARSRETGQQWRVPTENELKMLFNHRAYIGGFNTQGMVTEGVYWSATGDGLNTARTRSFANRYGGDYSSRKGARHSVRLVRD